MKLFEVFPEKSLKSKFQYGVNITQLDRKKLKEIIQLKSSCVAEIGGGAWDRYVQNNPNCDSQALSSYFQENSPKIYLAMERYTGIKVLKDISYTIAEVVDENLEEKCCAELLLAVTYPNVLRISDVTFCDLYKKIPVSERKYRFQEYKGLNLFPELLENCQRFCKENNISEITLSAAYIDLVPFFVNYGFQVEDTPAGRAFLEYKEGIPMRKLL